MNGRPNNRPRKGLAMIRLTNLADYAVVLMCDLAVSDHRLNAQDLSGSTGLPVPTVSKILNALARANILDSKRGIGGGFALSRPATALSVAHIVEAIDGPIALTTCMEQGKVSDCAINHMCQLRPRWQVINRSLRAALESVKIADLIAEVSDEDISMLMRGQREDIVAEQT